MDERLVLERGSIFALLAPLIRECRGPTAAAAGADRRRHALPPAAAGAPQPAGPRARQRRPPLRSRSGSTISSSTATGSILRLFRRAPTTTLEEAQVAKKRHIAAKLCSSRGSACSTSAAAGAAWRCTCRAPEASRSPASPSRRSSSRSPSGAARRPGWRSASAFALRDYRDVDGPFDRIVSVGMFEHVGAATTRLLRQSPRLLKPTTASRCCTPSAAARRRASTDPGLAKYIFPGGYMPSLSEVLAGDRAGGPVGHRRRDAAAALRARPCGTGARASWPGGPRRGHVRRAVLPDVGVLPRRRGAFRRGA